MADLAEITEDFRTDDENGSKHEDETESPRQNATKRKRTRSRRNSRGSQSDPQTGRVLEESQEEDEGGGRSAQPQADDQKQGMSSIEQEHQAKFYEDYRKVAQEFDKEFLKKYEEDLNTTLIFAGLFSAVTSAFIIQVATQLQPDPGDETAALLRIIIYKMDNTTFGNDVPTLPQWTGPPRTIVHVQAILFASLAASLFSAFLAMLGKQWLNRYESTDMRGSAIERSQSRQRKLDGINSWYFNYVMESLPLMLQAALLLLGCALSRYLWDIDITIASVVLGITSIGVILYVFIIIAGVATKSCPYQTPGSQFLLYLGRTLHSGIALAFRTTFRHTIEAIERSAHWYCEWGIPLRDT
ncbi:hypothetical protein BJ322DRAFT_292408 [Thelephora terrestris]|uniref:DUF6535 domain-containing protein n=1 Tax=Thelephora terrestris TaxID=56493 RepID=A0A9P6H719_9AGAM|nr:hypothetical protein BJ322DRAFT_292408 [Thelephora terrestris]